MRCTDLITIVLALICAGKLDAADSIEPGDVTTPYPTITNLAVKWQIEGDDDLDATCEVGLIRRKRAAEVFQAWTPERFIRLPPSTISVHCIPI